MKNLQNQNVLSINRLSPRSIVIPASEKDIFYSNKERSDRIIMLTGEWDFKYCDGEWGTLTVPSMWQFHGYGTPRYTNADYIFPFNPPYVGTNNPVGHYKRGFNVKKKSKRMILHFDGVDSAFYVYINGKEVGMSKGSRLASEFDIAEYVNEGENLIEVDVYTFCDGSYLESQDMILGSGIFRDVFIILADEVSLWDYTVFPTLNSVSVRCKFDYDGQEGYTAVAEIDGQRISKKLTASDQTFDFTISEPRLWNAETPNLYTLILTLKRGNKVIEVNSKKIGLRTVGTKKNHIFCINGVPVKLKGVNRHEHLPDNGRAIDYETTRAELLLLKRHNVNAIRCSHYPNAPFFYELANELGFYVMDEADLETHGCGITGDQGYLSKTPSWLNAYLDREIRMYERDKNETCIVIWSLGNESGSGENLVKCAEYFRGVDIKKPILYPQDDGQDPKFTDFRQCGYNYPEFMDIRHYETGPWFKGGDTPVVMTEYAHSMGNSPGGLSEYWDRVYLYDDMAGGFVWEFKNLGIKRGEDYCYGNDFGECNHSLNFNLDGLCISDGTPKPSMIELREVLAPTQVKYENGIVLKNTNSFRNLSYLTLKWELLENFRVIDKGVIDSVDLPAGRTAVLDLPYTMPECISAGKKYFVNLTFLDGEALVSQKQVALPYGSAKRKFINENFDCEYENGTVRAKDFSVSFKDGVIASLTKNGKSIIDSKMQFSFYRKPTDNDGIKGKKETITSTWEKSLLSEFCFFPEEEEVEKGDGCLKIIYKGKILPEGKFVGYFTKITYKIYKGGIISVDIHATPYGNMPSILPRIGVVFEMNKSFDKALWFGRGEHENYSDRIASANYGLYELPVEKMSFMYDRPQENGNREDTYFAALTDKDSGLLVLGAEQFSFTAQDYSMKALCAAEHISELKKADKNYFYINYKMRGIGSASCGVNPKPAYELNPHEFEFAFVLKPYEGIEDAEAMHSLDFGIRSKRFTTEYEYTPIHTVRENFESRD